MKQTNDVAKELAAIRKQLNRAKSHRRLALQRRLERLELKALQQEINDAPTEINRRTAQRLHVAERPTLGDG